MSKENPVQPQRNVNHSDGQKFTPVESKQPVPAPEAPLPAVSGVPIEFPPLDPAILAHITQAIQASIGAIAAQLAPKPVEVPGHVPSNTLKNPNPPPAQSVHTTKLKGIPVEPGEDLRHVHPNVINAWFHNLESRWKEQLNKRKLSGQPTSVQLTRG